MTGSTPLMVAALVALAAKLALFAWVVARKLAPDEAERRRRR